LAKKLYLIPTPIIENGLSSLPEDTIKVIHSTNNFIVENARTARRFIKTTDPPYAIQDLNILELDKHEPENNRDILRRAMEFSTEIGFLSDAGCPAIADPGSEVVKAAHHENFEIIPLIGPSSIFLALMGSGMNGQKFQFHGYLSPKKELIGKELSRLEKLSQTTKGTQIFIETPYRNRQILETAMKVLNAETRLCIAANVTAENQFLKTMKVKGWKKVGMPDIHKVPSIFLIGR